MTRRRRSPHSSERRWRWQWIATTCRWPVLAQVLVVATSLSAVEHDERRAALDAIREQIGRLEDTLSHLGESTDSLLEELERTELELLLQRAKVEEASAAFEVAKANATDTELRVKTLEAEVRDRHQALRQRLILLYKLGEGGYLRLVLSVKPDGDLLTAMRQLRYLVLRDGQALERYRQAKSSLESELDRLAAAMAEQQGWLEAEEVRQAELEALERRQRSVLARLEGERDEAQSQAAALAQKEHRLEALVDLVMQERQDVMSGAPIQDFRGVLDWPASGSVVTPFGPRLDPRYRTRVPHNGVEIETSAGAEVATVYPGRVLFAAPFEGFGFTVVVQHPEHVLTLYARLAELRVERGDVLSFGTVVGVCADTLYFEIRSSNRAENPEDWLR